MAEEHCYQQRNPFPRMQNAGEQFNETKDIQPGPSDFRNASVSINRTVKEECSTWGPESSEKSVQNPSGPFKGGQFSSPHPVPRMPVNNTTTPFEANFNSPCSSFPRRFPRPPLPFQQGPYPGEYGPNWRPPRSPLFYQKQHQLHTDYSFGHGNQQTLPARPSYPPPPEHQFLTPPPPDQNNAQYPPPPHQQYQPQHPPQYPPPAQHHSSHSQYPPHVGCDTGGSSVQSDQDGMFNTDEMETDEVKSKEQAFLRQREIDEEWVKNWLKGIQLKKPPKINHLKIHEAHDIIQKSMVLLATLQQQQRQLQSIAETADSVTWQQEVKIIEDTKKELTEVKNKLTDEEIENLKKQLEARTKKRERIKRKRKANYEEKLIEEKNREIKHQIIDKCQRQIMQKDLEEKQNKEIKASADVFLSEVRKKLSDVKKTIEVITALKKLRKIRRDFAEKQGRYSSVVYDEGFEKTMSNLTNLLKKQQDIYLDEEKTLKVMLENDWVEALEKEKEEKIHTDLVKKRREMRKYEEMLFGKQESPPPDSELYPIYQFYTQAEHSLEALIKIRRGWDLFIVPESVPGSSRIPDGWVLPSEPSSEAWAAVLKK